MVANPFDFEKVRSVAAQTLNALPRGTNWQPLLRPEMTGQRLRGSTSDLAVYLIDTDGSKRWIPDQPTYLNLFDDFSGVGRTDAVYGTVSGAVIGSGAYLARTEEDTNVWFVEGGQKRLVPGSSVMTKFGFSSAKVRVVPQSTLDALSRGRDLS
jgi:hypothetical protein